DGVTTELIDAYFERHPRPRRWLLEDHPDRAAGKDVGRPAVRFHLRGAVEQRAQLFGGQRLDREEVALHDEASPNSSATRSSKAVGSRGFANTLSFPSRSSNDSWTSCRPDTTRSGTRFSRVSPRISSMT